MILALRILGWHDRRLRVGGVQLIDSCSECDIIDIHQLPARVIVRVDQRVTCEFRGRFLRLERSDEPNPGGQSLVSRMFGIVHLQDVNGHDVLILT